MLKKNTHTYSTDRGFTLVELLLYVSIASFVLLVTSVFLSPLVQSRVKNQTIAEVEQQGLSLMQSMTHTIRNADAINSPAQGVADAVTLSVNTIVAGNNPTIFDLAGTVLQMKEGAAASVPLSNSRVSVSGLSFSNVSRTGTPGTVRIQFTLTHVNPEGRNEYDFSKTFIGSATLRQP